MAVTERGPATPWKGAVGYEVYIRSFSDSNGDGVGDLEGIRRRLPYLAWLGVDVVWVTPFYPSPGFDHGYDVSDFTDVDPLFGDLSGLRSLVDDAHAHGLKVLVDITPNHSSSAHPFFQEALRGRDDPRRDWFVWSEPGADGGPPNNWVSHFGGPAWTLDPRSGQYYCHLFLPEQPDFNWDHSPVREFFRDVLRFWFELGVDGFRVDVAHGLLKDPGLHDNPVRRDFDPDGSNWHVFNAFDHIHDLDQDATPSIYEEWAEVAAEFDGLLLGEVGITDPERIARYAGTGLHMAFFLEPSWMAWDPAEILARFREMHELRPELMAWVLDNHDQGRSATRFGGGVAGRRRSLALMTLLFGLGGMPFLYQGQELGLEDGHIAPGDRQDPITEHSVGMGRDGSRTPMPWEPGPHNGFTTGEPWLRSEDRGPGESVSEQRALDGSHLHRVRDLIAVRHEAPGLWSEPTRWVATGHDEVAMVVGPNAAVVANLSRVAEGVELPFSQWAIVFQSEGDGLAGTVGTGSVAVPPETSLIVTATASES